MRALTAIGRVLLFGMLVAACSAGSVPPAQAADNYMFNEGSQRTMQCDDVGGVCYQGVKLYSAEDGSSTGAYVNSSHEVLVKHADPITVDSELPTASALADSTANPTLPLIGGFMMRWNGSTWDRWNGRFQPPAAAPAATEYIVVRCSDGTIFETCGGSGGAGGTSSNFGSAFPTPGTAIGFSDGTNMQGGRAIDTDTGAGTVYAQGVTLLKRASGGPVELGTSTDPIRTDPTNATSTQVAGPAAHDAAVAGNPVRGGAKANANEPAAVSGDGDAVDIWADRYGRQVVLLGHPAPEAPVVVNATASGNTTVIAAGGAGTVLCIMKGFIANRDSTNRLVSLQDGAGGTTRWRAEIAAEGGAMPFNFGERGWCLTDNTLLNVNLDNAGSVDVNVNEYAVMTP